MQGSDPAEDSFTEDSSPDPYCDLEQEGESDGMRWQTTSCDSDASALFESGGEESYSDVPPSAEDDESQWDDDCCMRSPLDGFQSRRLRTCDCDFSVEFGEEPSACDEGAVRPLVTAPRSEPAEGPSGDEQPLRDVSFASRLPIQVALDLDDAVPSSPEDSMQSRFDMYQHAAHRRALQRRVDLVNQQEEEQRLRVWPSTFLAETPPSSRSTRASSAPSRSSLSRASSCDSLRVHRHRPKGYICKAFLKDLKRKLNTEIENEAWETDYKFPDYSLGIIPESYCLRSEFFEFDLLTQFGVVPGYPEGRGILESRSSKTRRGITEESYTRKRKHDTEYEKEMRILYDTKEVRAIAGESDTSHTFDISSEEPSSSINVIPPKIVNKAVQVNLDCEHQCEGRCLIHYNATPGTDEGYETTTRSTAFSMILKQSDILRMSKMNKKQFASTASIPSKGGAFPAAGGALRGAQPSAQRPKRLPPMPGRRQLAQKLCAANSDSRLELRLVQKNRHLPPIGERGQGDEPYKYVSACRKFQLPSKYPCLPPISKPQNFAATSSQAQMCFNN